MAVVATATKAIPVGEQVSLAKELTEAGKQEEAVKTLHSLITIHQLPILSKQEYAKLMFSCVDRMPVKERSSSCSQYESDAAWIVQMDSPAGAE
jgi:hypothetical protein